LGKRDDETYFWGKLPNKTYASSAFPSFSGDVLSRRLRYISKVLDSDCGCQCDVNCGELVIRETPGGRQLIEALFFEDDRSIQKLMFQRFTGDGTRPSRELHFSFSGEEIDKVRWLFEVIEKAEFDRSGKMRFADEYLEEALKEDEDLVSFVERFRERLGELEDLGDFTEYLSFRERRRQLMVFEGLLHEPGFFEQMKQEWGRDKPEAVWQDFFDRNPWIFGLSLSPVFLSSLKDKKLEQVVRGFNVAGKGKRVDALMRTNGILGSLSFVEIKTHQTPLLHHKDYRPGAWSVSGEVAGAIAQCHTTIQDAMNELRTKLLPQDKDGNPTGEEYYLYQPRSYLVVGCLDQFVTEHGVNDSKFRSFELYRRHTHSPEIVTFDKLLERARAIVDCSPSNTGF
jgi:hypothetical protein